MNVAGRSQLLTLSAPQISHPFIWTCMILAIERSWFMHHISSIRCRGYFFSLFILVWLLFEGSIYLVGKLVDSNDDWNRYMWAIQIGMIDVCVASQSCCQPQKRVLEHKQALRWLSNYQPLAAIISMHVRVPCILAMATTIWRQHLIEEIRYSQFLPLKCSLTHGTCDWVGLSQK